MENRYTPEDMKSLYEYLCRTFNNEFGNGNDIDLDVDRAINLIEFYNYDYKQMISDSPMLLNSLFIPYENLPLYINDIIDIDRFIVLWRLQYGV